MLTSAIPTLPRRFTHQFWGCGGKAPGKRGTGGAAPKYDSGGGKKEVAKPSLLLTLTSELKAGNFYLGENKRWEDKQRKQKGGRATLPLELYCAATSYPPPVYIPVRLLLSPSSP